MEIKQGPGSWADEDCMKDACRIVDRHISDECLVVLQSQPLQSSVLQSFSIGKMMCRRRVLGIYAIYTSHVRSFGCYVLSCLHVSVTIHFHVVLNEH